MSNAPTISVLMAVYDTPLPFLDASIKSILTQSFDDFEFIIVDDGSNDSTRLRLYELAAQDRRIRLHSLPSNIGLTRALNIGLELVKGKYIARQDADDLSSPERLDESYSFLETHPEFAAAGTNVALIDQYGDSLGSIRIDPSLDGIRRRNVLVHGSMMFRTEIFRQIGGYDERMRLSQDYELYLRMLRLHSMRIGIVERELYSLRQHAGSLSSKKMFKQLYFSVLAKSLTLPNNMEKWQRNAFFIIEFVFDLVFTHRMLLGPLSRRYFLIKSNRAGNLATEKR